MALIREEIKIDKEQIVDEINDILVDERLNPLTKVMKLKMYIDKISIRKYH